MLLSKIAQLLRENPVPPAEHRNKTDAGSKASSAIFYLAVKHFQVTAGTNTHDL